jgi:hypothetical protein
VAAADSLEESKALNYTDDERFAYEEMAEQCSVAETLEQLSVIEKEVNMAADISEENKNPNPNKCCRNSGNTLGNQPL